jgi:hypothetical protein
MKGLRSISRRRFVLPTLQGAVIDLRVDDDLAVEWLVPCGNIKLPAAADLLGFSTDGGPNNRVLDGRTPAFDGQKLEQRRVQ